MKKAAINKFRTKVEKVTEYSKGGIIFVILTVIGVITIVYLAATGNL